MIDVRLIPILLLAALCACAPAPSALPPPDMSAEPANQQLLTVSVRLSNDRLGTEAEFDRLSQYEDQLEDLVRQAGVGEFDGNEVGDGLYTWFFYGPDAARILATLRPRLREMKLPAGSFAILRKGGPGAPEEKIELGS
jgi:hypothetical protein